MARKKKNEELQRQQMLQNAVEIAEQLKLNNIALTIQEKSHIIFGAADKVMTEICEKADSIKIDGVAQFKEMMADIIDASKDIFMTLVDIRRKAIYGELDADKLAEQTDKLDEATDWAAKNNLMQKQLYASLTKSNGELTKVLLPATVNVDINEEFDEEDAFMDWPDDVKELIDTCAKTRQYINTELWPKLAKYADCFAIECQAETWEFYDLLKWWHYRHGGYPKPGSKPYAWDIIDKFQYMLRQCRKYGFDFTDGYIERFGLEVNIVNDVNDSAYSWDL